jgi:two-component system sensor histidine kinase ChvG
MASDTGLTPTEPGARRASLRWRILAVNLFIPLALLGGVVYLDSYRARLVDERLAELRRTAVLAAQAVAEADHPARAVSRIGATTQARVRLFAPDGRVLADSWAGAAATFQLRDPAEEPGRRKVARVLDRTVDWLAGASSPEAFPRDWPGRRDAWAEARAAAAGAEAAVARRAPDRTLIVSAAAPVPGAAAPAATLHLTADARDITFRVRDERLRAFQLFLIVLGLSLLLSTFLARTIVRPLRALAQAAVQVRRGRARDVVVPRLPDRRDEIGRLARALSDMTGALRQRIDKTEAFAADVAHELKNPLASLRSALDTFERVEHPASRDALMAIMRDDVARLDRLITAIADASRLDAELSRATFEPIDLSRLARDLVGYARVPEGVALRLDAPERLIVPAHPDRLALALRNLIDNALSFSPPGGTVRVALAAEGGEARVTVEDEGPGVPADALERIFDRFTSLRDAADGKGHSGLGLAIARAVAEGHGGAVSAMNRPEGGARFTLSLPGAQALAA